MRVIVGLPAPKLHCVGHTPESTLEASSLSKTIIHSVNEAMLVTAQNISTAVAPALYEIR